MAASNFLHAVESCCAASETLKGSVTQNKATLIKICAVILSERHNLCTYEASQLTAERVADKSGWSVSGTQTVAENIRSPRSAPVESSLWFLYRDVNDRFAALRFFGGDPGVRCAHYHDIVTLSYPDRGAVMGYLRLRRSEMLKTEV